jgi:glucan phosphoethanolaminetransferase (alkaline phosphatase superfamily)
MNITKKEPSEKLSESDGQMLIRISKKFVVLFILILMFDSLLDWLFGFIDIVVELIHIVIEFFEYSLEIFLEHIFNANHHESEIIIVNFVIIIALYGIYRFCFILPQFYIGIKRRIKVAWLRRKQAKIAYGKLYL